MTNDEKNNWLGKTILFLTSQTITLFGSSLVQFAISWYIVLTYESGKMVTLATICGFLPQVLISLFSGVWADRFNRKLLIILADGIIALFTGLLAICWIMGVTDVTLLFGISIIRSLGAGLQTPAVSSLLPTIAPKEHLLRVNGVFTGINSVMTLLSPAIASWLLDEIGIKYVFLVDVATAAVGISLLALLKVQRDTAQKSPSHVFVEMGEGLQYIAKTVWLRQYLLFYLLYAFMFGPFIFLTPLMVKRSFGDVEALLRVFSSVENLLVAHEVVFSLGCLMGGLLVTLIASRVHNKSRMLLISCLLLGVTSFAMGFSRTFYYYLATMLPMGMMMPFINTSSTTVLQANVKPDYMGRVFSFISVIGTGVMPLSMILFGPLSDVFKIEYILIATGVVMIILAVIAFNFKEMVKIGIKDTEAQRA